jgi:hypothetical protein
MIYTQSNFIQSIEQEFTILKHLAEKIPSGTDGYKPTEKQRTTLELLQYLSTIFSAFVEVVYKNDVTLFPELTADSATTTVENFGEKMDAQLALFKTRLAQFTDADFAEVVNIYGGGDKTKAVYLIDWITKWAAAYKTQLFLYIKSSGNTSIGTMNLWAGMDMPSNQ